MSDEAKPWDSEVQAAIHAREDSVGQEYQERTLATVRALEAERAAHEETRQELAKADAIIRAQREGVVLITTEDEYRALEARAEKAERERDEARAQVEMMRLMQQKSNEALDGLAARAERAKYERDEARARVAQLEEVLRPLVDDVDGMGHAGAVCSRFRECDDPDGTACTTHDDSRECPECECGASGMFRLAEAARAALSTSPSDWLAEHDRSIAEHQREACAARVESRDILREYAESACRATPLVTK